MNFVFLDQDINKDFINGEAIIAPLEKLGEVNCFNDTPCSQEILYERAKDANVIIFSINQLEKSLIKKLSLKKKLKLIQFMGIGYKNYVDVEYCASLGISVAGVGEYGSNAIAEYAIGLMLSLIRGINIGDRRMKNREWNTLGLLGGEIKGSIVGVVGTGAIGRLVAQKVKLLGGDVIAFDQRQDRELIERFGVRYVSLEELMKLSDIVTVHIKHTAETDRMISARLLSMMKLEAVFINTARAQVVDYGALYKILRNSKIRAAAIDVHNEEPPRDWDLVNLENVISTPHIAYFTAAANTNLLRKSVESVLNYLNK